MILTVKFELPDVGAPRRPHHQQVRAHVVEDGIFRRVLDCRLGWERITEFRGLASVSRSFLAAANFQEASPLESQGVEKLCSAHYATED